MMMKKASKLFLCILLVLFFCSPLWAADFGLILDQTAGVSGNGDETNFDYSGILIPRFSTLLGSNGEFFISAGMRAEYSNKEWTFVPELLRTEFDWRFGNAALSVGRINYSDPLGYIAAGLFDGARFTYDTNAGTFGVGAWYTGFMYKNRAYITMTPEEGLAYGAKVDYDNFADTYFAPRRLLAAIDWEHPSLANLLIINFALMGQFDLTKDGDLNSEYAVLSVALPIKSFIFDVGGSFELIQDSGDSGMAFTADLGIGWMLPTSFASQLSFLGRYASAASDSGNIYPFLPLTTVTQGYILKAKLSSITLLQLEYAARVHRTVSLALTSTYFIRNDLTTYTGFGDEGKLLGNEFFVNLFWSPVSDLQVNLGGGLFLPSMGNVAPDAKSLWRIELGATWSLF